MPHSALKSAKYAEIGRCRGPLALEDDDKATRVVGLSSGAAVMGEVAGDWDRMVGRDDRGAEVKWRLEEKEGVEGGKEGVGGMKEGVGGTNEGDDAATVAAAAIEANCSSLPGEGVTIKDSLFELRVFLTSCGSGGRSMENECEEGRNMGTGGLSVEEVGFEDGMVVEAKVEAEFPDEVEADEIKAGEAKVNWSGDGDSG